MATENYTEILTRTLCPVKAQLCIIGTIMANHYNLDEYYLVLNIIDTIIIENHKDYIIYNEWILIKNKNVHNYRN